MKVKFLGGVNTIGGNCFVVESADNQSRIMLDFGMNFGKFQGESRFYEDFLKPRGFNELKDLLRLDLLPRIPGIYQHDLLYTDDPDRTLDYLPNFPTFDMNIVNDLWYSPNLASYSDYARDNGRGYLDAVLVTHAHMDHIKYLKFLDPAVPIYLSPISRLLLEVGRNTGSSNAVERKIVEIYERKNDPVKKKKYIFTGAPRVENNNTGNVRDFHDLTTGNMEQFGSLKIMSYPVDHSVPGALAFKIYDHTDETTLVYTGDLRFHGPLGHLTRAFQDNVVTSENAIDAMICEGTRISVDELTREDHVKMEFIRAINKTQGLVAVSFPWKNIFRYQSLLECARETGRTLVIDSKLAYFIQAAKEFPDLQLDSLDQVPEVKVLITRSRSGLFQPYDYSYAGERYQVGVECGDWDFECEEGRAKALFFMDRGVFPWDIRRNPEQYILQLNFYDMKDLVDLAPPEGFPNARYIISSIEPYEIEQELQVERLNNWLEHFGLKDAGKDNEYIHSSGHASRPELEALIQAIKPGALFPVHTEHIELFEENRCGCPIVKDLQRNDCFAIEHGKQPQRIPDFIPS